METSRLPVAEIEHLLWDRMLHRELVLSGKDIVVDKTPGNLLLWRRLVECWPQSRFIFLLRHPLHILESAITGRPEQPPSESEYLVTTYLRELDQAIRELDGLIVRYEELTEDPEKVIRRVCVHLDVPWEPQMLAYGEMDHGPFVRGIGDFTEKIRSGVVLPGRDLPDDVEVPASLRQASRALGYAGEAE